MKKLIHAILYPLRKPDSEKVKYVKKLVCLCLEKKCKIASCENFGKTKLFNLFIYLFISVFT